MTKEKKVKVEAKEEVKVIKKTFEEKVKADLTKLAEIVYSPKLLEVNKED